MKFINFLILLIVFIYIVNVFPQECGDDMSTLKFVSNFPYGGTTFVLDYDDAYIIKWNNNKINDDIYLNNIDIDNYMPFELLDETDNIGQVFFIV